MQDEDRRLSVQLREMRAWDHGGCAYIPDLSDSISAPAAETSGCANPRMYESSGRAGEIHRDTVLAKRVKSKQTPAPRSASHVLGARACLAASGTARTANLQDSQLSNFFYHRFGVEGSLRIYPSVIRWLLCAETKCCGRYNSRQNIFPGL